MKPELSPNVRIMLCDALCERLYAGAEQRLKRELDSLIEQNSALHNNDILMMRHGDRVHLHSAVSQVPNAFRQSPNLCHREMREHIRDHLKSAEELRSDRALVTGYFQQMFTATSYAEDFLRVLPPSLHQVVRQHDRHFLEGDGVLIGEALDQFMEKNAALLSVVKKRLTLNLLES